MEDTSIKPRISKQIFTGFLFLLITISGVYLTVRDAFSEEEILTNDTLHEFLGNKVHGALAAQRERLGKILDGFLVGNWDRIQNVSGEMIQDLNLFLSEYKNMSENQTDQIRAVRSLQEHGSMLKASAAKKDYQESYKEFTSITNVCMRCHEEKSHLVTGAGDSSYSFKPTLSKN